MTRKATNPANTSGSDAKDRNTRIPMSMPRQKLEVDPIPGYHLHWMMGTPARIAQAQRAGYTFVDQDDVDITNTGLGDDASKSGNTDLGSRVSIIAGSDAGEDGYEQRLYLMKIPTEFWEADQKLLEDRNEQVAASLRGTNPGGDTGDISNRYIPEGSRKSVANLFTRKQRSS